MFAPRPTRPGSRRAKARAPLSDFSLPGGVVEVGETLAAAVARKLMEEVGIEANHRLNRHMEAIVH